MSSLIAKLPPHHLEAEQATLGAMMLEFEALEYGCQHLKANDFYREPHAWIFEGLVEIYQAGKHYDPLVLEAILQRGGKFEQVGGTSYLMGLLEHSFTAASVEYYGQLVRDMATRREIIALAQECETLAHKPGDIPLAEIVADMKERWQGVAAERFKETIRPIKDILHATMDDLQGRQELQSIKSGLRKLDNSVGGFFPGSLYILAARPRQGKSTLLLNWLTNISINQEIPAAMFSMEMKDISLAHKILAAETGIDAWTLRTAKAQEADWLKIAETSAMISTYPLYIDDSAGLSLSQLLTRIRKAARRFKVKVVGIDYLQLLHVPGLPIRESMVASTHAIKAIARELDISIILLSQISRAAEGRFEGRPTLADLKESSSIEEDADVVFFIYHPDERGNPQEGGNAELMVAKNRLGPGGQAIKLYWRPREQKFYQVEKEIAGRS